MVSLVISYFCIKVRIFINHKVSHYLLIIYSILIISNYRWFMETTSFISTKVAKKLLKVLIKVLKNSVDKRNNELIRINDIFGNCEELAKFYIQPDCQ